MRPEDCPDCVGYPDALCPAHAAGEADRVEAERYAGVGEEVVPSAESVEAAALMVDALEEERVRRGGRW